MNKNVVFLSFRSWNLLNRHAEFKFGGPRTELYARDHPMHIDFMGKAIENLGGESPVD